MKRNGKAARSGDRARLALAAVLALALVPLVLSSAAAQGGAPPIPAFANGLPVLTVATEASDAGTAAALGVTLSPPLAAAIGAGATSARYQVTNIPQPPVLSQVPNPVGPGNGNADYSPLWQVFQVTWKAGMIPGILRSEADVMAAQQAGRITVTPTSSVINGPVVATTLGGTILPLAVLQGFALGDRVRNLITDTSDAPFAAMNNVNYAPKLSRLLDSSAVLDLYKFFNNPANPAQLTFFDTHPQPVGPGNQNSEYTPMWHAVAVHFTFTAPPGQYPVITSSDQLDAMEAAGKMAESDTNIIIDCPITGVEGHAG